MNKLFYLNILILIFVSFGLSQREKRELVILQDDFSSLQWQTWSFSRGDSIVNFKLTGRKSRSAPSSVYIEGTLNTFQDEWLVSPLLNFSHTEAVPLLTFYEDQDFWLQSTGTHELLYAQGTNPSKDDFISLLKWTRDDHMIVNFLASPVKITLDELAGKNEVKLAFRYHSDSTSLGDNWFIDDLKITQEVLYDAAVLRSSLSPGQKISTSAEFKTTLYVQNRGLEKLRFKVKAELHDYTGLTLWSDADTTGELEPQGLDTLSYTFPAGQDSAWYEALFIAEAEADQYRGNDTLKVELQSYRSNREPFVESFLFSGSYFSEGAYLIADSVINGGESRNNGQQHFFSKQDTLLYRPSSELLAKELLVDIPSYIFVDRKLSYYFPYTSLQDWQKKVGTISSAVSKEFALGAPVEITGSVSPTVRENRFDIEYSVTQTADLPEKKFKSEIWIAEANRNLNWLRVNKLRSRSFELIREKSFISDSRRSLICDELFSYDLPDEGGLDSVSIEQALFFVLVCDETNGEIVNSALLTYNSGSATPVDDAENTFKPADFRILRSYPNPFNPSVTVSFYVAGGGRVKIEIYSADGRKILSTVKNYSAGRQYFRWNAGGLASGIYFLRMAHGGVSNYSKLILAK
jgi:hypothetical protein